MATKLLDPVKAAFEDKRWLWLFLALFFSLLLPEYVAPVVLTTGYLIFVREQKKRQLKIKLGVQGKAELLFMCYMLLASLWSATHLFSAAMAGLFFWMWLCSIFITGLCTDQNKLQRAMRFFVWGGGAAGAIGVLQFLSKAAAKVLGGASLIPDPLYLPLDKLVFEILPFSVKDKVFADRTSGPFTNPNIGATLLVMAFPFALYFLMTAVKKRDRLLYLGVLAALIGGIATSKSRIALAAILAALVFGLFCFGRKKAKWILLILVAAAGMAIPLILTRYSKTIAGMENIDLFRLFSLMLGGRSSETHHKIWAGCIDYLSTHPTALLFGLGGGTENSWNVILSYGVNQPHAHNLALELCMEYGLLGSLLFFVPVALIARNMICILRDKAVKKETRMLAYTILCTLICYHITGLTDFLFNTPKQVMLLFVLYGFAHALQRIAGKPIGSGQIQ